MKISFIVSTLKRSGPTNQLFNLLKYLDKSRFCAQVITLSPECSDSRVSDFQSLGIKVLSLNQGRLEGLFCAKSRLASVLANEKPDIVHSHGIRADYLVSRIPRRIPRLSTIHNFPQLDYTMRYGFLLGWTMTFVHTRIMKRLDCCVGVSEAVAENLVQFGIQNCFPIRNGVDKNLIFLKKSAKQREYLRKKLGLPVDGQIWISSGHLSKLKDPLFLIKMWKRTAFCKDMHLVFIGDGELFEACKDACGDRKNIHLIGRIKNVADYLGASDYFISASKAEGLPMAVIEALACGLPVLLSDISPHRELWAMNARIGCLFELDNPDDFDTGVKRLFSSDYDERSFAADDLVKRELCAEVMAERYQDLYLKIRRET